MFLSPHLFSIPVMGTGHSIDSPIRVAPFGINSVISVVDDLLIERIRKYYCTLYNFEFVSIPKKEEDGRAKRITAYLEVVKKIVELKFEEVKAELFFQANNKAKYFEMLPDESPLKKAYVHLLEMREGKDRDWFARELTEQMVPGSIDVNIMAKVDLLSTTKDGEEQSSIFSDACSALRGYANSSLSSSIILSAGFNPRLYNYIPEFKDFYRDKTGEIKKKIILKVSDFRSALIQGKYLAKKGLEVFEYRIESGLNCGGHAFASDGYLLPSLLKEFKEKKEQLVESIKPIIEKYYESLGQEFQPEWFAEPRVTVQGGIGTFGESKRLQQEYGMNGTGWGTPFLMVPEATTVDDETRKILAEAQEEDVYLSNVSPLGVPFNNVRNTGSERWHKERIAKGKPGSPCPKGFLKSNTEFTEEPICVASTEYQLLKIDAIKNDAVLEEKAKTQMIDKVLEKACLCDHLGNGILIELGVVKETRGQQAICPGPNIAWFNRDYSLKEMVNHIYGKTEALVSSKRPHMFAKEMVMYVDYLEGMISKSTDLKADLRKFKSYISHLEEGMVLCNEIGTTKAYKDENLGSLSIVALDQYTRLEAIKESIGL
tara:strand:+ start:3218 stop:5017 length:1800 start_codon:yes stop_codon:yes gene_type:complete